MLQTLVDLGFDLADAQVYVFLAKRGAQKASSVYQALKMNKQQLYPCLKKLQSKGIVTSSVEHPAKFSAIPFEQVLDLFIKAKMEEARSISQKKQEILANWQTLQISEGSGTGRFTVIEGRKYIYSRIQQMVKETTSQLSCIFSVAGLVRIDQFGLFQSIAENIKPKIQFRFLTELSDDNKNAMKNLLREIDELRISCVGRIPQIGLPLFPRVVIRDDQEAIFFISPRTETPSTEQDDVGLWTNCFSLVCAFKGIFDQLWSNSNDIREKIAEIETGKPMLRAQIIGNAAVAKKTYYDALYSATHEVILMLSPQEFSTLSKNKDLLKRWVEKGVGVKIMAPIASENLAMEQEVSKYCEVRHVPTSHLRNAVIDDQLFQFSNLLQERPDTEMEFGNTLHTDNSEFVQKAKSTLLEVWKNACSPSINTLTSILAQTQLPEAKAPIPHTLDALKKISAFEVGDEKPLTEQDILDKILTGKKYVVKDPLKDLIRGYGNSGQAVIHPPKFLNLPDMMIHAFHHDKKSSFGNEDYLTVYLWLPTGRGNMFVPVAVLGDVRKGEAGLKLLFAGTPAGQNVQIVKKDQIQLQLHGNQFFAGWTVPIPLIPSPYILPPCAVILEAFGEVKTAKYTITLKSGSKVVVERNGFDAFVTFIHPESKYSGPGTDGFVSRDLIMTTFPPP